MVLFDGPHTYTNVALYAFLTGSLFGAGAVAAYAFPGHFEFGVFIASLGLFHVLEYLQTSLWNPDKLSLDSFLLNHSNEYHLAISLATVEYLVECLFFPSVKRFVLLKVFGCVLSVAGMAARAAALYTAKSNFNHIVQTTKAANHTLVTHGIYAWCRHPSYAGFFWFALGTQVLLANPVMFCGYIYALYSFFVGRIQVAAAGACWASTEEEAYLQVFFGDAYRQYKRRVPTLIPFIR